MTTKLTLTIEEKVITAAKTYAKKRGTSVSDLVEAYLKDLAGVEKEQEPLSPQVKKLVGIIDLPEDFDYKEELKNNIRAKHSK